MGPRAACFAPGAPESRQKRWPRAKACRARDHGSRRIVEAGNAAGDYRVIAMAIIYVTDCQTFRCLELLKPRPIRSLIAGPPSHPTSLGLKIFKRSVGEDL